MADYIWRNSFHTPGWKKCVNPATASFLNKKSCQINLQSVGLLCSRAQWKPRQCAVRSFTFSHSTRGSLLINLCKRPGRLLLSFASALLLACRYKLDAAGIPKTNPTRPPNPSQAINLTFLLLQRWITREKINASAAVCWYDSVRVDDGD